MSEGRTPGLFGWNELVTTDPAAAQKFFGSLLGWSYDKMPVPGGGLVALMSSPRPVIKWSVGCSR